MAARLLFQTPRKLLANFAKLPALRSIYTARGPLLGQAEFDAAKDRVNSLNDDPGNEAKLKLYALFKQGSIGPCSAPKPGAFDFVGKAKWTAWNGLGSITKEEAQNQYIQYVDELAAKIGTTSGSA